MSLSVGPPPPVARARTAAGWSRLRTKKTARAFRSWLIGGLTAAVGHSIGYLLSAAVIYLGFRGELRADLALTRPLALAMVVALAALLLSQLWRKLRRGARVDLAADFAFAFVLIGATFALLELSGGVQSRLYPLVYGIEAFVVATLPILAGLALLLVTFTAEAILMLGGESDWELYATHLGFGVLFAALSALFLRAEVGSRRRRATREISEYLDDIRTTALEFRLTSGLAQKGFELGAAERATRRQVGSVEAIKQALYNVLGVAEHALGSHTVALLWLDQSDRYLHLRELRSRSDHVREHALAAGEGVFGAITKRREPLLLTKLKPGHAGLCYYERPEKVTDFAGVPVLDGAFLRGVLLADRTDARPFTGADVAVMTTIAEEVVRTIEVERVFAEMDRDKYQKEHFYEASRRFNQAQNIKGVAEAAIDASKKVAPVDFVALAVSSETENHMRIEAVAATAEKLKAWEGKELSVEHDLLGAAIKASCPLPHGTVRVNPDAVFGRGLELPFSAVKVFPLIARDKGVGALVLASDNERFLSSGTFDMMRVIADHTAIALANAQLYEHNERLATTDGLTGLYNHRQFQSVFDQLLAQAERYKRSLSFVLTDIDHFKSVNDTYGHPVGDQVLKRVAAVLAETARARIDLVARYGGEEFALLLPETDLEGALRLAERARQSVAAEVFCCENGKFKVTLSLGIATFDADAKTKAKLIDCADRALYAAKSGGRNRSVAFCSLKTLREVSKDA